MNKRVLREFKAWDVMPMVEQINRGDVQNNVVMELPWTASHAKWWLSYVEECAKKEPIQEVHFAIEHKGEFVGSIGLINIRGHRGELGFWISSDCSDKSVMHEAVEEMMLHAFDALNLHRVAVLLMPHNHQAIEVLESSGFVKEGELKHYFNKQGSYVDAWCFAKVRG